VWCRPSNPPSDRGTREGGDIREFADLGVGDVRIAVAVAVIAKGGIGDAAALADFNIGAEGAVGYLAGGMDEGGVSG